MGLVAARVFMNGRRVRPVGAANTHAGEASVRVIVGEPASTFRDSVVADLARRAELEVAAVGTSTGMVLACASRRPDVAVVADDLPPGGGVDTVERLAAAAPDVLVVLWANRPSGDDALAALRAGARGVLARQIGRDALTRSILRVADGQVVLPRDLERAVVDELQGLERGAGSAALTELSAREREVLALLAEGQPNRVIAATLGISAFTVKRHVHNILCKFDVPSRAAAAQLQGAAHVLGTSSEHDAVRPAR
jgi:DNA-binding NarL/FixJ family response regulator